MAMGTPARLHNFDYDQVLGEIFIPFGENLTLTRAKLPPVEHHMVSHLSLLKNLSYLEVIIHYQT